MIEMTWQSFAVSALFILVCTVLVYLIVLIRNLNDSVKAFRMLLKENKENMSKTLQTLPVIVENVAEISDAARNNMKVVETAIHHIGETVEMTAATAQTIRDDVLGKVKSFFEIIELIWRVFFKSKAEGAGHNDNIGKKKDEEG